MKVRSSGGETRIVVPSAAGRDLGLFVIFFALVGTWPLLYIYQSLFTPHFVEVKNWAPALDATVVLTLVGLLFMFNTRKDIRIRDHLILVRDGFWHRALRFTWKEQCTIKMRAIETELRHRVFETWQIKLSSDGYEYLLDARPNQQMVSRRLAECLSRTMGCDLVEQEDKNEIIIAAKDLDLPFRDRVAKYPRILGNPVPQPANLYGIRALQPAPNVQRYAWDLTASGLLVEILVVVLIALFMSRLEWNGDSIFLTAVAHRNYSYYYGVFLLLAASLIILPGYQASVTVGENAAVLYQVTIWRLPVESISLPLCDVEEIRQHEGIRGPMVQIISASRIISFRVTDRTVARWLAYQLGLFISNQTPVNCGG